MKKAMTTTCTRKADIVIQCLFYAIICIGAIYTTSNQFANPYILPKWVAASVGVILLASYSTIRYIFCAKKESKHNRSKIKDHIVGILIFITIGQVLYGIFQFFGFISSTTNFRVTGNFDNPAGFAVSLCSVFPFYLYAFLKATGFWRWIIGGIAMLLIVAVVLSESRAGILSLSAVLVLWGLWRLKLHTTIKWIFFPLLLVGIVAALYFMKKDSADGRLLIWKCSLEMIRDNWLFGYGTGGFAAHYMDYQADYFQRNPDSVYTQLADTVQHPFNEYIGLLVNFGVIGLFLLFICVVCLLYCYFKHPVLENKIAISCWLSVGVFALFSYPLMYPFVWFLLLYSAYLLIYERIKNVIPYIVRFRLAIGSAFLCTLIYVGALIFRHVEAELRWKQAFYISLLGKTENALEQYKEVYAQLKADRYFLYNYSAELYQAKKYEESLDIALKCREHWADYDVEMLLGELCENLQQPVKAEQHYQLASYMCPCRFHPLYQLYELYRKGGDKMKVSLISNMILEKPVKIDSPLVKRIKRKVRKDIESLTNKCNKPMQ